MVSGSGLRALGVSVVAVAGLVLGGCNRDGGATETASPTATATGTFFMRFPEISGGERDGIPDGILDSHHHTEPEPHPDTLLVGAERRRGLPAGSHGRPGGTVRARRRHADP